MLNVQGSGRLGKDAELRDTKNGSKILTFSIASNSSGSKDSRTTTWLDCVILSEKRALALHNFFKKGKGVVFTGTLQSNEYKDADGNTKYGYSCIFDKFEFMPDAKNETNKDKNISLDDEIPF